ncbi:MAG TPA: rhodanese-like domain-containing protein [Bdellovibrionota bacterium]|nr:rhodanese-like domain-containing protein [Bdellovibrionota bacterium]
MAEDFTMQDLHERLGKLGPQELVLDVRTAQEFAEGHVKGARNIPHEEVAAHAAELKKYSKIYLHCRSGKRAGIATQALEAAGLKNIVPITTTGMMHWLEAGYPVQTAEAGSARGRP